MVIFHLKQLCRRIRLEKLQIKKFPTVLIYKGGERLSEVLCKQAAIDDINKEIDQLLGNVEG